MCIRDRPGSSWLLRINRSLQQRDPAKDGGAVGAVARLIDGASAGKRQLARACADSLGNAGCYTHAAMDDSLFTFHAAMHARLQIRRSMFDGAEVFVDIAFVDGLVNEPGRPATVSYTHLRAHE